MASIFSDLIRNARRRLVAAFACAVVIVAVTVFVIANAWLAPRAAAEPKSTVIAEVLRAYKRPRPTPVPTPPPTPKPTPTPKPRVVPSPVLTATPQAIVAARKPAPRAAQHRTTSLGHGSAPRRAPRVVHRRPVTAPESGTSVGTGTTGTGAAAGTAPGNGAGGLDGPGGAGSGGPGTGSGGAPADIPCGFVELHPIKEARFDRRGHAIESVAAVVHYPDKHTASAAFPYEFTYPNDRSDPFAIVNEDRSDLPALVQPPPPGTDMTDANPVIVYILNHTDAKGFTTLVDCPEKAP